MANGAQPKVLMQIGVEPPALEAKQPGVMRLVRRVIEADVDGIHGEIYAVEGFEIGDSGFEIGKRAVFSIPNPQSQITNPWGERMERMKVQALLQSDTPLPSVLVKGWVRTRRDSKDFVFLEVNDGSCLANIQIIAADTLPNYAEVARLTTGSAVSVTGELIPSPGKEQRWEISAKAVEIIQTAPENYPLQKKRHTDEYLRTIAHLRPRTNKYGAIYPHPFGDGLRHPYLLPRTRFSLCAHADHHRFRLRRGRQDVSGDHAGARAAAARRGPAGGLYAGLLRQTRAI